jgi:hypothetical protein
MNDIEQNLANWGGSLMAKIPVGGLLQRNPIVYKWTALYRVWMVRELTFWREHDLMTQSYALHQQGLGLGARILLRSGFETMALLTYLNLLMQKVAEGKLDFHAFCAKTTRLLLGSKNIEEMPDPVHILDALRDCDKRYPGLMKVYDELSESAHPNYDGLMGGYSKTNRDEYESSFSNRWMEKHGERTLAGIRMCMATFHHEYDSVWPELMDKLEAWVEGNDAILEATKHAREAE